MSFKPCLLVPVYNHGAQLKKIMPSLLETGLPCLLVNDGSEPGTVDILNGLVTAFDTQDIILVKHLLENKGKGVAVLEGVAWAKELGYSHAVQIDADGQHDIGDITAMLTLAENAPNALVSGNPQYDDSVPKARLYGRYITHFWVWVETLSTSIVDSMCGFRVYPVTETLSCANKFTIGQRMDFDTDIMVKMYWSDVPVLFLPTRVHYPEEGVSHFSVLMDNLRISIMHTRLVFGMLPRIPKLLTRKKRLSDVISAAPTEWYSQKERGVYWGMKISLWCYSILGKRAMNILLNIIVFYYFLFNSTARKASQHFLQRVYEQPEQKIFKHAPNWKDSYRHFMAFGDSIVDRLAAWKGDMGVAELNFPDREKMIQRKEGLVLVSSHLGNMELCRALCAYGGARKINVLLYTDGAPVMNKIMREVNPDSQMELISVKDITPATAFTLQEKYDAGEWIVIAADRVSPDSSSSGNRGKTLEAEFLGGKVQFPQGAFVLAALLSSPLYCILCIKQEDRCTIHAELLSESIPFSRRLRQPALQVAVQSYAQVLEKYCKQVPLQWFNFYEYWLPEQRHQESQIGK